MVWIDLIYNLALLVALSVVSGFVDARWKRSTRPGAVLQGVVFGGAAVIGMLRPFVFAPGLIFDGRSVMISLGALFFGPWAAAVACLMTIPLRIVQGGPGAVMGVLVILASAAIGTGFHLLHLRKSRAWSAAALFGFGVLVHVTMLALTVALPADMILPVLKRIGGPVLLIYPLATVCIGRILSDQAARSGLLESLRKSEESYRMLFREMQNGFAHSEIICDSQGRPIDSRYLAINPAFERITGTKAEEVVGKTLLEVFPGLEPDWIETFGRVALTGEPAHFEKRAGALGVCFEVSAFRPAPSQYACTFSDITARKQAEEALQHAHALLERRVRERTAELESTNNELEAFTYSASHDLRTPLRAITGFAEIIARRHRASLNEEGRHYFDNIAAAGARMNRLLDDLLKYSRLGRRGLKLRPVALRKVCDRVVADLAERIRETGATLTVADDLPEVLGEPTLLEGIFSNLLGNALTYRRPDVAPRIRVTCETDEAFCRVCVADNGIGIPEEHLGKIFNVFQRLHSEEQYPGSGIGLAIVRKSASLLGAEVGVESTVGQGSTFRVRLARARPAEETESKS